MILFILSTCILFFEFFVLLIDDLVLGNYLSFQLCYFSFVFVYCNFICLYCLLCLFTMIADSLRSHLELWRMSIVVELSEKIFGYKFDLNWWGAMTYDKLLSYLFCGTGILWLQLDIVGLWCGNKFSWMRLIIAMIVELRGVCKF